MAIYQLPNGQKYSVPDSVPRDVAIAKLKERFGGQDESFADTPMDQGLAPERLQAEVLRRKGIADQQRDEFVPTGDSILPQEQPQGEVTTPQPTEGWRRTALEQGIKGATFGFGDKLTSRLGAGIASVLTDEDYDSLLKEAQRMARERSKRQIEQRPITSTVANVGGSLLTGGAAGTTRAGGALARRLTTGGVGTRVAKGATAGAATGGLYGAGTAEEGKVLEGIQEGAIGGAVVGGALPAVGTAIRETVLPKVGEATKMLAERAKQFNIPLSIDQVAPSKFRKTVQKVSQQIPFSGVDAFEEQQKKAFSKAIARTIGQETEDLSPAVIKSFKRDANNKFGNALIGSKINVSQSDVAKLKNIATEAETTLGSDLIGIVNKNVANTIKDIDTPDLKGVKLANIRSALLGKAQKAQGEAKIYIGDMVDVIDDIAERSVKPEKAAILSQARREYRNYKTIEPLLEKATDGTINPTQLLNRVAASKYIKASEAEIGQDELVDLARIGKDLLVKAGGSDTFEKTALGAGVVGTAFDPMTGALLAGTAGANRLLQVLNRLNPRVAKAVEKGGSRFIPESLMPAVLSGMAGATAARSDEQEARQ